MTMNNMSNYAKWNPCPCNGCKDRKVLCHGTCTRYADWSANLKECAEEVNRKRNAEGILTNYAISSSKNMSKPSSNGINMSRGRKS